FLYSDELDLDRDVLLKQGNEATPAVEALRAAESVLRNTDRYTTEQIETCLEGEVAQRGWKKGSFYMPIRVAISAKTKTPPLFPMLAALGKRRTLKRLRDAIDLIAPGVA